MSTTVDLGNSPYSLDTLQKCIGATNCDVYDTAHGAMIRFVPGMEPGSQDYQERFANGTAPLSKTIRPFSPPANRQVQGIHSIVTFGDNSINYGTINPSDAVHHLYDTCHEGSCDTTLYTVDTQDIGHYGQNSFPRGRTLSLHANGQYDGWDERNTFVDCIVAAFSHQQVWKKFSWLSRGPDKTQVDSGDLWMGRQSNFIDISRWDDNHGLHGFMNVRVELDSNEGNWCPGVMAAATVIASALDPFFGLFFGALTMACTK